jgi:hypothetical protein
LETLPAALRGRLVTKYKVDGGRIAGERARHPGHAYMELGVRARAPVEDERGAI